MHTTNQMYSNKYDSPSRMTYLKADLPASAGCYNVYSVDRMFMKVYDSEGLFSHILSVHAMEEHSAGLGSVKHQEYPYKIKFSIFDDIVLCTDTRVNVVYIHNGNNKRLRGYYYLVANYQGFSYSLLHCTEGYLKVISMMDCYVIAQQCSRQIGDQTLTGDPKLAYDNYQEGFRSWQRQGALLSAT